jgi:predicted CoA-substrate-specific enzyme activase
MSEEIYLGIDSGAVSLKTVLIDNNSHLVYASSKKNHGDLIKTLKAEMENLCNFTKGANIKAAGVIGSGRKLIGSLIGADVLKNEITAHFTGTIFYHPDAATIIEIGGQDSKIIIIEDGIPIDFDMSGVCGAGTGSFLEQQAMRLNIKIEDFGEIVESGFKSIDSRKQGKSQNSFFGGGCGIFIESAMIKHQQMGIPLDEISAGLCDAVVTNYLNDTARGKKIKEPVYFQGGVAGNQGIVIAFKRRLGLDIIVPENYLYMGATGVALIAKDKNTVGKNNKLQMNKLIKSVYSLKDYICEECEKNCRLTEITSDSTAKALIGKRCEYN